MRPFLVLVIAATLGIYTVCRDSAEMPDLSISAMAPCRTDHPVMCR
jgi:hypothetical protein